MSLSVISSPYHNAVHNANFVHITECQTEITLADDRIFTINWAFTGQEDSESWWKKKYIYIYITKYQLWNFKMAIWFGSKFSYVVPPVPWTWLLCIYTVLTFSDANRILLLHLLKQPNANHFSFQKYPTLRSITMWEGLLS